jgi:hypothetical protein
MSVTRGCASVVGGFVRDFALDPSVASTRPVRVPLPKRVLSRDCLATFSFPNRLRWGLGNAFLPVNTMSTARFDRGTPYACRAVSATVIVIFPASRLRWAFVLCRKSIPSSPAASVGRGHTKNSCSKSCPPNLKETVCWPLISRFYPDTPRGSRGESFILARDTPGWSIETFDPVSSTKRLARPSTSNQTVGVACSTSIETVTAFFELLR